jgi:hypothetical protein
MSEETRAAVFGNVGTLAVFRVGQRDAEILEKEFSHAITANTMVAQDNHHICMRLLDQGTSSTPFQAATLPKPTPQHLQAQEVIAASRQRYSNPREGVERAIYAQWYPSFILSFDE